MISSKYTLSIKKKDKLCWEGFNLQLEVNIQPFFNLLDGNNHSINPLIEFRLQHTVFVSCVSLSNLSILYFLQKTSLDLLDVLDLPETFLLLFVNSFHFFIYWFSLRYHHFCFMSYIYRAEILGLHRDEECLSLPSYVKYEIWKWYLSSAEC